MTPRLCLARLLLCLVLCATALSTGCGPYLYGREVRRLAYESSQACAQGPFTVTVPATGARWGERVAVFAVTPRALGGHWELLAGGQPVTGQHNAQGRPANEHCLASPVGEGASPGGPAGAPGAAAATPGIGAAAPRKGTGGERPGPGAPDPALAEPAEVPHLVEIGDQQLGEHPQLLGSADWAPAGPDDPPPLRAGLDIRFRFWSDEPNDLRNVRFVLVHEVHSPSVSDAEWAAELRRRAAAARAEALKQEGIARTRQAREIARADLRSAARNRYCHTHPDDTGCWGPGGMAGARARMERDWAEARRREVLSLTQPRPRRTDPFGPPPDLAVRTAKPVRADPPGPPPPPRAEVRMPRPSLHAEWISGYWSWAGTDFRWIGGWWRVPDEDRRAGQTATAPTPPPPPPVEPALQQAAQPGAVWVAGSWHWDGRAWIWAAGTWQTPPQTGWAWQAPSWRIEGLGVRLDPGGWVPARR